MVVPVPVPVPVPPPPIIPGAPGIPGPTIGPISIPSIPTSIPVVGPAIEFIGNAEHAVWDNVWGWVKGAAQIELSDVIDVADIFVDKAVRITEEYVGKQLAALSGFINDAFDFASAVGSTVADDAWQTSLWLWEDIKYLDAAAYTILADVVGIEGHAIPDIIKRLLTLETNTWGLVGGAVAGVEAWAIDNIYGPLDAKIEREIAGVRTDVWNLTGAWVDNLLDDINAEALKRAAAIAGVTAAVAAVSAWVVDCGEPMCQTLGPKTDLGKLLKGLKLATELAALTALLEMDEGDLADLIHSITARMAAILDDVEQFLSPGGETVAGLIAAIGADVI